MLPHMTPRIWLTCELANTLELMISTGLKGITLDQLKWLRVSEPRASLEQLISGGAVIHMEMRLVQNRYTASFEETPHYIFKGWIQ
jgi:hypothetical protein